MANPSGGEEPEVRLAARAMATRFEIVLSGKDAVQLRSIGEEALSEICRIGRRFSFFDPSSELSRLNARAAHEAVPLAPDLYDVLTLCKQVFDETGGAFDPSVGALIRTWSVGAPGAAIPGRAAVSEALSRTGFQHVELDQGRVRFLKQGLHLDLGGVAKGWAIDRAMDIVAGHGVGSCLLHGGTSSVRVMGGARFGADREGADWRIGLADPYVEDGAEWFASILLRDQALSVSGVRGKVTTVGEVEYGHVVDPRTGEALSRPMVAAVVTSSAAVGDALSTAFLVMNPDECAQVVRGRGFTTAARFLKTDPEWVLDAGRWPSHTP